MENRHRSKVTCADPQRLTGSIDLDSALARQPGYANDPRWEYGLGYRPRNGQEQAVWVEVHPAKTDEVSSVLRKQQWLREWLNANATLLKQLTDRTGEDIRFVWIASAGVKILKNSPQSRQLSRSGVHLKSRLDLP